MYRTRMIISVTWLFIIWIGKVRTEPLWVFMENDVQEHDAQSVGADGVDVDAVDTYNEFKKSTSDIAYIVLKIENNMFVVDKAYHYEEGEKNAVDAKGVPLVYKKMKDLLIKEMTRYAFYKMKWVYGLGEARDAIVLIQYNDDNADVKMKLLYSTSSSAISKSCRGIHIVLEASDKEELGYYNVLTRARNN